jgi:hypothetical protein
MPAWPQAETFDGAATSRRWPPPAPPQGRGGAASSSTPRSSLSARTGSTLRVEVEVGGGGDGLSSSARRLGHLSSPRAPRSNLGDAIPGVRVSAEAASPRGARPAAQPPPPPPPPQKHSGPWPLWRGPRTGPRGEGLKEAFSPGHHWHVAPTPQEVFTPRFRRTLGRAHAEHERTAIRAEAGDLARKRVAFADGTRFDWRTGTGCVVRAAAHRLAPRRRAAPRGVGCAVCGR